MPAAGIAFFAGTKLAKPDAQKIGANMTVPERPRDPLQRWIRVVRARPRLFLAVLLGLVVVALVPTEWRLATRSLVAWDVALALYVGARAGRWIRQQTPTLA